MDDILVRGLRDIAEHDGGAARILADGFDLKLHQLERYIAEIELFNDALGLVGAKDHRELVIKHILDSLSPLGTIARLLESAVNGGGMAGPFAARGVIADAGSGAGLPGIPLALCFPETRFVLIERMGRRAGFLRNATAAGGFSSIEVEETEVERAAPGRFSVVVFRAFRPLGSAVFKSLLRLAAPGGYLAAWKGRRENAAAEIAALGNLPPGMSAEIIPSPVPFLDEERCLVALGPC